MHFSLRAVWRRLSATEIFRLKRAAEKSFASFL